MTRPFSLVGLVLGCALLLSIGCGRAGPLSPDQAVATRQVGVLVPRGTPEVRARKSLSDRGFALSRLSSDHASNHLTIATYTTDERMWQVGLIIVDERVAATSVTITDLSVGGK